MRYTLFAAGLAVCPLAVGAQTPVPARLSLADALAIAKDNNPAYRQALNNASPAAWAVRNAYSSLLLPSVTASAGMAYSGPGEQSFLTNTFTQSTSTISSNYSLGLSYTLSGQTLSLPGQRKAEQHAVDADIDGAAATLVSGVTQQYLTVLQAQENAGVAQQQLTRNEESLKLAQARYAVGQATLIDVRQAQVLRGQAEVTLLQAQTAVSVEKLRLFEQLGVTAPVNVQDVVLTDSFAVTQPAWSLDTLLGMAAEHNPALQALRAREGAAAWAVRSSVSSYGPSVSLSAGWSGFTQQFTNVDPLIQSTQLQYGQLYQQCLDTDTIRVHAGLSANCDPSTYVWGQQAEQQLRSENSVFPFNFTKQPFQARLSISLPLFTNWERPAAVSQAKATHENLEESVRARALGLQTEVSQAYLNLQTAYRSIAIQDTNRSAAREQLQLATERYRVGNGTFLELQDAQVSGLQAELAYVTAVYDYHRALAALEAAVGRPLR